jgi:rhodanese-related sulfurtransferase
VKTITPPELNKLLAAEPDLVLLDVCTPLEHAEVHVAHSRNEPLVGLRPKVLFDSGRLSKDRPVYLICRTGGRAARAAEKFAAEGFDQGVVVEGGTAAWIAAGLPVERGPLLSVSDGRGSKMPRA